MKKPTMLMPLWLTVLTATGPAASRVVVAADDSFARARQRMVAEQLSCPGRDITNARVLTAMGKVPRHEFVPERLRATRRTRIVRCPSATAKPSRSPISLPS